MNNAETFQDKGSGKITQHFTYGIDRNIPQRIRIRTAAERRHIPSPPSLDELASYTLNTRVDAIQRLAAQPELDPEIIDPLYRIFTRGFYQYYDDHHPWIFNEMAENHPEKLQRGNHGGEEILYDDHMVTTARATLQKKLVTHHTALVAIAKKVATPDAIDLITEMYNSDKGYVDEKCLDTLQELEAKAPYRLLATAQTEPSDWDIIRGKGGYPVYTAAPSLRDHALLAKKFEAIENLRKFTHDKKAWNLLVDLATTHPAYEVQEFAIKTLGESKDLRAIQILIDARSDEPKLVTKWKLSTEESSELNVREKINEEITTALRKLEAAQ